MLNFRWYAVRFQKDNVLIADEMPVKSEQPYGKMISSVTLRLSLIQDITFKRHCTEFIIGREKKPAQNHRLNLRAYLESIETAWW